MGIFLTAIALDGLTAVSKVLYITFLGVSTVTCIGKAVKEFSSKGKEKG